MNNYPSGWIRPRCGMSNNPLSPTCKNAPVCAARVRRYGLPVSSWSRNEAAMSEPLRPVSREETSALYQAVLAKEGMGVGLVLMDRDITIVQNVLNALLESRRGEPQ